MMFFFCYYYFRLPLFRDMLAEKGERNGHEMKLMCQYVVGMWRWGCFLYFLFHEMSKLLCECVLFILWQYFSVSFSFSFSLSFAVFPFPKLVTFPLLLLSSQNIYFSYFVLLFLLSKYSVFGNWDVVAQWFAIMSIKCLLWNHKKEISYENSQEKTAKTHCMMVYAMVL